jgi:TolA-binding protein
MESSNTTVTTNENQPSRNIKNLIIGLLVAGMLIMGGFLIFNHNKTSELISTDQTEIAKVMTEKSDIQNSFDASLARLDSMKSVNAQMDSKLTASNDEITKMKSEIRSILNKKNATTAELTRAKNLIAQLNGKITDLETQVAQLTQENDSLKQNVAMLTSDKQTLSRNLDSTNVIKQTLEKKVDVASTLNASNITITPLKVKNNGKTKVSTVAKRVDKLVVSFDVNNRIIQPGSTDLYVVVIGPDGQPVTPDQNADTFVTREDGNKTFTAKLPVDLETAKTKNVQFAFAPGKHFQQGNYKIQIYQNGFLIGEKTRELKKGGLFS